MSQSIFYISVFPGLFKTEWEGDGFIGLNAKTYSCSNEDTGNKYSSKGLSRKLNLTKEDYLSVINEKATPTHLNRGFVFKNERMLTYCTEKSGLNYLYTKRKVLDDGVSTTYLDV